jgi:hypothetical protein
MMLLFIKEYFQGKCLYLLLTLQQDIADVDQKGTTTVLTSLKTIGITELQKQVGDKKYVQRFEDEVQVATGSLFGDDDATHTNR